MSILWRYSVITTPYGDIDLNFNQLSNLAAAATKDGYIYKFSPRRMRANKDNYDQFNLLDKDTGCLQPLFMLVPCGKCELCKEKKLNEWRTRTFLECQSHDYLPHFITLTYKPALRPYDGLKKEEIQLFMKRLRDHCDRYFPDNPKLRFIACGEYGHNTHLPHYHLLIWNLPKFDTWKQLVQFIEERWPYGFVYVKPCQDSLHGSYICKYMRKDCVVPTFIDANGNKKKCKPCFWLSSRGNGGLGIDWLRTNAEYYRDNHVLEITEKDKFTSKVHRFSMPSYFTQKLYPTIGRLLPREVRIAFADFMADIRYVSHLRVLSNSLYLDDLKDMLYDVCKRFSWLDVNLESYCNSLLHVPTFLIRIKDKCKKLGNYSEVIERVRYNYELLTKIEIPTNTIVKYLNLHQSHLEDVNRVIELRPDVDTIAETYKINQRIIQQHSRDIL